jgi:hypothetical protein
MSGDIVKRLQSARRWLEKAEHSFDRHEEVSGELNLIMAQAEMQRLKETRSSFFIQHQHFFKWLAAAAAVCLFVGISSVWHEVSPAAQIPPVYMPESVHTAGPSSSTAPASAAQPGTLQASVPQASPAVSEKISAVRSPADTGAAAEEQKPVYTAETQAPRYQDSRNEETAVPVMSQQEIQSVVGDAGRALRGRS